MSLYENQMISFYIFTFLKLKKRRNFTNKTNSKNKVHLHSVRLSQGCYSELMELIN